MSRNLDEALQAVRTIGNKRANDNQDRAALIREIMEHDDGHPLGAFNGIYHAVVMYFAAFIIGYAGYKVLTAVMSWI